ncbi:FitA-like ribbon-helix-helix domain-containing protein [Methylocystis sp.]|uniref:FitA-like ribbon-helix-helix domain-containing protein n=1 Tax=Methylocystis sp. TaxID=1911079 RepID=UPI003DA5C631
MNAITIKSISPQAIARIQELAAVHRRTVEEEAADLLEKAVSENTVRAARLAAVDRIAAMTPKDVEQTDSTLIIREARDQR